NSPALAHYAPWLRDLRTMRPYQLSDEVETLLHEKSVSGRGAWNRLYDETLSRLTFDVDGKAQPLEAALSQLSDRDANKRQLAARSLAKTFEANIGTFTLVTNTLAKDKEIEDRWR